VAQPVDHSADKSLKPLTGFYFTVPEGKVFGLVGEKYAAANRPRRG